MTTVSDDLLSALDGFNELDRAYADADAHDDIIRTGWVKKRNERMIAKYGSLQEAEYQARRDAADDRMDDDE